MRITVFLGSAEGRSPSYAAATERLAALAAAQHIGIVYGGASVGCMGRLADAARAAGGQVIGVIPAVLIEKEVAHTNLTELVCVSSMHERKLKMAELADAFVALPGGLGTLEEIFEVLTWCQLGIHRKPCCFVNVDGYYDHLMAFLDHALHEGFLRPSSRALCSFAASPEAALAWVTAAVASGGIDTHGLWHPPQSPAASGDQGVGPSTDSSASMNLSVT